MRAGAFGAARRGAALCATRAGASIAEMQARYAEEAGTRQLKIKHNNFLGYYIETPQAQGETLLKPPHSRDLHPSPDHGGRDALHHQRADRSGSAHRLGRRSRAGARTRSFRAAAAGVPRPSRDAARPRRRARRNRRRAPRSPNSRSSATGSRPHVDDSLRLHDRGRAPSRGRGGARRGAASPSSPTTATSRATSARAGASRW